MEIAAQPTELPPNPQALDRCEETLWVIRARDGDAEAFNRLMARHEQPLLYYLRRFIGQTDAALDAHQEVWLEVFRGLRRLRTPEAFRSWLYQIAHDRAVRFIRREIREEQFVEPLNEAHHDFGVEPESVGDAEAIHRALDRLPALQREVLTLYYLQDLGQDEMAIALNCPIGTIKSRLHHARTALRSLLGKENYD